MIFALMLFSVTQYLLSLAAFLTTDDPAVKMRNSLGMDVWLAAFIIIVVIEWLDWRRRKEQPK